MREQTLILVDKNDNFLGYAPRNEAHQGRGKKHRAFVTLLFDSKNQVFLQKRRHRLFDNFWDLTAISHPLHLDGGNDETYQEASDRALKKEMGIGHVPIKKMGAFNYFARDGENCENEYCAVLMGHYDGDFKASPNEVYEAKKVKFEDFIKDIAKNPQKYTPWARLAASQLKLEIKVESQSLLQKELKAFLSKFDPYLASYFAKKVKATCAYSPFVSRMYEGLADFSSRGKKMRAFLVWLGYRIGKFQIGPVFRRKTNFKFQMSNELRKILPISLAFEMTQSFFLIHDDIIDHAPMRRTKPTIHEIYGKKYGRDYGQAVAIVLGDIACLELFNLINSADFDSVLKIKCVGTLVNMLLETAYGQTLDIENSYRKPSLSEIYKVTDLKTARYSFVGPLTIGAILAGAKNKQLVAIEKFGTSAGLAFQIQDDILGVFGDEETLGKSVLSDMREGKNTILIYKTREMLATNGQGDKVVRYIDGAWGNRKAGMRELERVGGIIKSSGALDWCRGENARLVREAWKIVPEITKDENLRQILREVADFAAARQG